MQPASTSIMLSILLSPLSFSSLGRVAWGAPPPGVGSGLACSCKLAPPFPGWWAALGALGPLVLLPGAPLLGGAAGGGASLPPLCLGIVHSDHAEDLPPNWAQGFTRCVLTKRLCLLRKRVDRVPPWSIGLRLVAERAKANASTLCNCTAAEIHPDRHQPR